MRRGTVVLAVALVATGCSSSGRNTVIFDTGRIGPLKVDRSSATDVIAYAGSPDVDVGGVEYGGTPYRALGYDCSREPSDDLFPVLETPRAGRHGPSCKTVFWINSRTRRLGDVYTSSNHYSEEHGVRIGMKTASAERLLHVRAVVGCGAAIFPGGRRGIVTVALDGGFTGSSLNGGHVYAFALHGGRSDIGIFDCL